MKKYNFLLTLVIIFMTIKGSFSQNIHQSGTFTLPQAPATSFIVSPGQAAKISSTTAVTLGDGVHFQAGSNVKVFIGNPPMIQPAPNNPDQNLELNWAASKTYDEDGNIVAEDKSFFDNTGKFIQGQVKNLSMGHVLASQNIYDAQGRPVISTLAAPINNSSFSYRPAFVCNLSGAAYSIENFDLSKTNNPDPVGNSSIGTLGWYYSNNNTLEAYVPATSFPYARASYYNDGTSSTKGAADVGEQLRMGLGREVSSNSFPVLNELDFYAAVRARFFPESTIGNRNSLRSNALQNVFTDQNGQSGVEITDLSGKPLMTARGDVGGILTVANNTLINAVAQEYLYSLTTAGLIMGGSNPNGGGLGGGPVTFGINSKYNVKVYKDGGLIFDGTGNDFIFSQLSLSSSDYVIKSANPFTVSHSDGCSDCPSRIAESDLSSIHYFHLLQPANVSITGSYELYDMKAESAISSGFLPAGYYKVIALNGDVNISYTNKLNDVSFAFYNELGQVVASIAPEGVKALIINGVNSYNSLSDVPFVNTNEYDLQGRLISSTSTDGGRTEYIYRKDGNIRFTQNAEQRKLGNFSYTNYDQWARPVESGEYKPGDVTFTVAKSNLILIEDASANGGLTGGVKQFQNFIHYDLPDQSHGLISYVQDEAFIKGGISWTENSDAKTWYNYDEQGRVKWIIKSIDGLGIKTINYQYSAKGGVESVDYQKENPSERFLHFYDYDGDARLNATYTSTDGQNKLLQAQYYYYLHGPLKRVELGDNLQGIDYTYTADGKLKTINHPDANNDPGKDGIQNNFASDAFAMTLEYFNGDYIRDGTGITSLSTNTNKAYYNGNIIAQSWKSLKPSILANTVPGINNPSMFTYQYDDKYQFDSNKYGIPNFANNTFTEQLNVNREYGLSYDANGNIQSLNRNNISGAQKNFNYHYQANTNKLESVDNYANYTYDDLGQMSGQQRTDGSGFYPTYTVSGKVAAVYGDAAKTQLRVSFGYDETGNRIRKTDHLQNINTYYVYDGNGNVLAIYDNNGGSLQQKEIPVYAEGRIGVYNRLINSYQFELTDHLGNVRVVINQNKISNQADVAYYSDYYPFGSPLTLANSDYRYGYQGKYAAIDKETGWNNFELRMYDPAIGRWMSTDPYGEHWSPYLGMGNDPVSTVDPDGGCEKCPHFKPLQDNTRRVVLLEVTIRGRGNNNTQVSAYQPNWAEKWNNFNQGFVGKTFFWPVSQMGYGIVNDFHIFGSMLANGPNEVRDVRGRNLLNEYGTKGQLPVKAAALLGVLGTPAFAAELSAAKGGAAAVADGSIYSVAYEMKLASSSYPGVYRGAHFLEANKALSATMAGDARFASAMSDLGVAIPRSSAGSILGKSPANWVWHHDIGAGVMQLVPKGQHTVGSSFWGTLHPNGLGGFAIWGK